MKLVVWDFDGTLAERPGMWSGALAAVAARHRPDLVLSALEFRPSLGQGYRWHAPDRVYPVGSAEAWWSELEPIFEQAFRHVGLSPLEAIHCAREVRQEYTDPRHWQVFPDTVSTLTGLSEAGWTHAILTNHVPEFRALLSELNLADHFAFVINSAETGYEKPHPEAFAAVLKVAGHPAQICMVGDSLKADIGGARGVGWPSFLVRTPVEAGISPASLFDVPPFLETLS